jgi:hypothetical protein
VYNKAVQLDERAFIEQKLESLASRQLSFLVLCLEARLAAPLLGFGAAALKEIELLSHGHSSEKLTLRGMGI